MARKLHGPKEKPSLMTITGKLYRFWFHDRAEHNARLEYHGFITSSSLELSVSICRRKSPKHPWKERECTPEETKRIFALIPQSVKADLIRERILRTAQQ